MPSTISNIFSSTSGLVPFVYIIILQSFAMFFTFVRNSTISVFSVTSPPEKGIDIFVQGNIEKNDVYITSGAMIPFSENDFLKQIENATEIKYYI